MVFALNCKDMQQLEALLSEIQTHLYHQGPSPRALALILKGLHRWPESPELQAELWWLLQELPLRPAALHPELRAALLDSLSQLVPAQSGDLQPLQAWSLALLETLPDWKDVESLHSTLTLPPECPTLLQRPLVHSLLKHTVLSRPAWELALRQLRAVALQEWAWLPEHWEPLWLAMACQSWNNQYLWFLHPSEEQALAHLLSDPSEFTPCQLALMAIYFPLSLLKLSSRQLTELEARSPGWQYLLDRSLYEPAQEAALASQIPSLSSEADAPPEPVQAFYEAFPYPHWEGLPLTPQPPLAEQVQALFPEQNWDGFFQPDMRVLIAGCGTGQQLLLHHLQNPEAQLTGLDLSRRSLAQARRKLEAYQVPAELYQGDLQTLTQSSLAPFDLIESVGVLHHLRDPQAGLKALLSALKPGGLLKLGLYSQKARQPLLHLRASLQLNALKQPLSRPELRRLRQAILENPNPELDWLKQEREFYHLHHCLDLLCHPQEHNFNLPELAVWFQQNELQVMGLELWHPHAYRQYQQFFPDDPSATHLEYWSQWEQEEPKLFWPMYLIWLSKKS